MEEVMKDIRLVGNDEDYLLLESLDGQKYRLLVDDVLRSSVKKETSKKLASVSMSPRQIQDAIRAGSSIEEVAATSGASIGFVENFAVPVFAELNHVLASALSVRLGIDGDRSSEHLEFETLIADRLASLVGTQIKWSAKRVENGLWPISLNYTVDDISHDADWSFDARKLTLTPENKTAISLSSGKPVIAPAVDVTPVATTPAAFKQSTSDKTVALSVVADEPKKVESAIDELFTAASQTDATTSTPAPLSATADLLEALRRKRSEQAEQEVAPASASSAAAIETVEKETPQPQETESPAPKKGRASMPSWDEIVFGTKTED
jgi:hypothetical protein